MCILCLLTKRNRKPLPFDGSYTIRVLQNNGSKTCLQRVQLCPQFYFIYLSGERKSLQ